MVRDRLDGGCGGSVMVLRERSGGGRQAAVKVHPPGHRWRLESRF